MSEAEITRPSTEEIRENRLKKKIERLKKQRDHYQEQCNYYSKVLSMQPYLEKRYETYQEMVRERERIKGLEQRVKEQALLIRVLSNDKIHEYEIRQAYTEVIKSEHQKISS